MMKKPLVILPAINLVIALCFAVVAGDQIKGTGVAYYLLATIIALPAIITLNQHRAMLKFARLFLFTGALFTAFFAIFSLAGFLNISRVPGASLWHTILYTVLCVYLLGFKGYLNVYEEENFGTADGEQDK